MSEGSGFRITPRLILGLFVVAVGVLFLLGELNIYHGEELYKYWPVILIAIGLTQLLSRNSTCCGERCRGGVVFPLFIVGIGVWLLLNNLDIVAVSPWDYFWPMVFILAGLGLIFGSRRRRADTGVDGAAQVSSFCLLSGSDRKVNAADFRSADLTAIMGGCSLDLSQAGITSGPAEIEVFALMGGIDIKVPPHWSIESKVLPLFGAVSDETRPETAREGGPRLLIRGSAIMGGVEITN
jgi:hypothetical protein